MKHTKLKRIPNSLRKYRRARGLKQDEVAQIVGLKTRGPVSRWEAGHSLPKTLYVLKMAVLYRTMTDALFIDLRRTLQRDILKAEKKVLHQKIPSKNDPKKEK